MDSDSVFVKQNKCCVKGKKHVGKACDYKRQVMGIPKQVRVSVKALFLIFCSSATECAQGEDPQEGGAQ